MRTNIITLGQAQITFAKSFLEFPQREPDFRLRGNEAMLRDFLTHHIQDPRLAKASYTVFRDGEFWNVWRDDQEVSYGLPKTPFFDMGKAWRQGKHD